ncbi:MAG: ATP-dependent protease LonB [Methylocystaceae bacterium]
MHDIAGNYGTILYLVQFFFAVIIGLYFWNLLKQDRGSKNAISRESEREKKRLQAMQRIKLSEPLSSLTRPATVEEIIGQEDGVAALKAALCGPNPQHVIIYGPPGIGKTAAARLVLDEARKNSLSPFSTAAAFVEVDATISRFDERSIADPLIGSVHDPIYQGAGALGLAGIPQPKPGAVTKAHGGILFIDEIGELHPLQMNKLLKVLEERKVFLESAYYSPDDDNIPPHIHEIFKSGLPADFRLVGATTRSPQEISPAIRSRCLEVFFRPLEAEEIVEIARRALVKVGWLIEEEALQLVGQYATNGREAVNIIQLAVGLAQTGSEQLVTVPTVEKVFNNCNLTPRQRFKVNEYPQVGTVNGLALTGNVGQVMEIEVSVLETEVAGGDFKVTGIIEEEEMQGGGKVYRRQSMAVSAGQNVLTALRRMGLDPGHYDIHVNFPGGMPVDGPSAGISMGVAIYSAITNIPVDNLVAMTGEITVLGLIKPVGGIMAKVDAARRAGLKRVIIPADNWLRIFDQYSDIEIITVNNFQQGLKAALADYPIDLVRAVN